MCAWQDGYRAIAPGFVRRIAALRALELPAGLALAGDYTMSPTVEGAVRSGERAADRLTDRLTGLRHAHGTEPRDE